MIAGYAPLSWLGALIVAILIFALVYFGLPWLLGLIGIAIPHVLVLILAILAFIFSFWGSPRYIPGRA